MNIDIQNKECKIMGIGELILPYITTNSNNALYLFSTTAQTLGALFGIVFSLTLVAIQLASQTYSPRLTTIFLRKKTTILFIGFYLSAIFYNIILLNAIPETNKFHLFEIFGFSFDFRWFILGSIVLSIISAFVMVFYIVDILKLLKPENIIKKLIKDIETEKVDNDFKAIIINKIKKILPYENTANILIDMKDDDLKLSIKSILPFENTLDKLIDMKDEYAIMTAIKYLEEYFSKYIKERKKIPFVDKVLLYIVNFMYERGILCLNRNLYCSVSNIIYFLSNIGISLGLNKNETNKEIRCIFDYNMNKIIDSIIQLDEKLIKDKMPEFKRDSHSNNNDLIELIKAPLMALGKLCNEIIKFNNKFDDHGILRIEKYLVDKAINSNEPIRAQTSFEQLLYITETISKNPQLMKTPLVLVRLKTNLDNISKVGISIAKKGYSDIRYIKILFDISRNILNNKEKETKYDKESYDIILHIIDEMLKSTIEFAIKNDDIFEMHKMKIFSEYDVLFEIVLIDLIENEISDDIILKNFEIFKKHNIEFLNDNIEHIVANFIKKCICLATISLSLGYNRFPNEIAEYLRELNKKSYEKFNKDIVEECLCEFDKTKSFLIIGTDTYRQVPIQGEILKHFNNFKKLYNEY